MSLANCRVVLVRPHIAPNLGAVARAMRNFGLQELVLVAPKADPSDREARRLSTHGEEILNSARIVAEFGEAVADCQLVVGTSARVGGPVRRQSVGTPEEVMPRIAEVLPAGKTALVFGPEATGLLDTEVTRCHFLITIPADPGYPALNLAQAVCVCLYELYGTWLKQGASERETQAGALFADQERMFIHLRQALESLHFIYGPNGDTLMHGLRHLLGRAKLTPMEVGLLQGLARQILWHVEHHAGRSSSPTADE